MPNVEPKIRNYNDYCSYLNDVVYFKKNQNRRWSLRQWSIELGLKSTSSISKIINGERAPGHQITQSLCCNLKLNQKEKAHFIDLIKVAKIKNNPQMKSVLLQRLSQSGTQDSLNLIDLRTFEVIGKWFHYAIREMSRLKKFKFSIPWISQNLNFSVSEAEVYQAIDNLKKSNLIEVKNKKINLKNGNISTSEDITSSAIQSYHTSMLKNAQQGLKQFGIDEREYLSGTLCFKQSKLPQAKKLLREFLNTFAESMDTDEGDEIYQIQMQFFPLSQINNKKEPK